LAPADDQTDIDRATAGAPAGSGKREPPARS